MRLGRPSRFARRLPGSRQIHITSNIYIILSSIVFFYINNFIYVEVGADGLTRSDDYHLPADLSGGIDSAVLLYNLLLLKIGQIHHLVGRLCKESPFDKV